MVAPLLACRASKLEGALFVDTKTAANSVYSLASCFRSIL
jgi:hypothetical protein